jgi:hypothetical protein
MTISAHTAPYVKRVAIFVVVTTSLLFLDGQLGPVSFALRRVIAAAVLAIILAVGRFRRRFAAIIVTGVAVALVAQAPTVLLALLGYVLAVAMLGGDDESDTGRLPPGLAQTCLSYLGVQYFGNLIPQSRVLCEALSASVRGYLRVTTGGDHHLSPTTFGAPAVLLLTIYLLWRWRLSRSWTRLIAAVVAPACWFLLLPLAIAPVSAGPIANAARVAYYSVFCLVCTALIDTALIRAAYTADPIGRGMRRPILIFACIASLLIGITLVGVVSPGTPARRNILVHNRGGLDWDRPTFGKFGMFSGGMFGLLPVYARANGYGFEVLDRDTIRSEDLTEVQTLVLINSPRVWKGEELRTVRDFVARGGGLLILGDHTDVFGLMNGFNSLLADFGISFQFDSAYQARPGWRGCLSTAPDAVTSGWDMQSPGMAIGASLKLSGWSRTLLCGRYGHSDDGIRSNVVGSFLGNYTYEAGEKLGDIPLIATATHGRGRVIVLGDTTPFQGGLSYSFPRTVGPLLSLLSRPTGVLDRPLTRMIAATLLIAILLGLWTDRSGVRPTQVITAMLIVGVVAAWLASQAVLRSSITIGPDCFLVDASHLPAVGHYEARINPSGPLDTNLLRSGLRVAYLEDWDRAMIDKSRGIAFIAPQRSFTHGEVDDLLRFEEAGGVVLIAVGQPDSSACRPLLAAHGLALANRPLGTVPSVGERGREKPHFLDAWPIVSASGGDPTPMPGIDVLYRDGKDVIALFRKQGRGGLLLFSDTRFFSSMNIEDMSGHWVGNLALIHDVFRKYLGVAPDTVRPLFTSPRKPE